MLCHGRKRLRTESKAACCSPHQLAVPDLGSWLFVFGLVVAGERGRVREMAQAEMEAVWNSCRALSVHPGCLALLIYVRNQGVELELDWLIASQVCMVSKYGIPPVVTRQWIPSFLRLLRNSS